LKTCARISKGKWRQMRKMEEIKQGDIFILGNHRLMCGDSLAWTNVQKLLDKHTADMMFTDPPYSVDYVPEKRRKGGRKVNRLGGIMGDINFQMTELLNLINTGIVKGAVYMCCGTGQVGEIFEFAQKLMKRRPTLIIWAKNAYSILNKDYHSGYECVMYFYYPEKKFRGEPNQGDVWYINRRNTQEYVHPTQKPIRLMQKAIVNSSDAGDIVLDLFGGSGSTLMACENTDRRCFMMELDPHYIGVIIKRWEAFTGGKAIKTGN
jgi:DNA modification methylase